MNLIFKEVLVIYVATHKLCVMPKSHMTVMAMKGLKGGEMKVKSIYRVINSNKLYMCMFLVSFEAITANSTLWKTIQEL